MNNTFVSQLDDFFKFIFNYILDINTRLDILEGIVKGIPPLNETQNCFEGSKESEK